MLLTTIYYLVIFGSLIIIFVEPKVLKFLKRPTRLKGFGLWLILLIILTEFYSSTSEGKFLTERAENSAMEAWKNPTYALPDKPDADTNKRTIYYLGKKPKRK